MLVKADPIYNITEGPAGTSRFRVFFFGLEPIGWVQRIWILILDRFSVLAGKWWRYPKNFELLCGLKRLKPTKNKDSHNDLWLRMLLSGALGGEDWMMPTCIKMEWQLTISPLDPSISKSPWDLPFASKEVEATNWGIFFVSDLSKLSEKLSVGCERVEDPNIFGFPFVWVGMPRCSEGWWMAGGAFMTTLWLEALWFLWHYILGKSCRVDGSIKLSWWFMVILLVSWWRIVSCSPK